MNTAKMTSIWECLFVNWIGNTLIGCQSNPRMSRKTPGTKKLVGLNKLIQHPFGISGGDQVYLDAKVYS
jgi:hypothetical protein